MLCHQHIPQTAPIVSGELNVQIVNNKKEYAFFHSPWVRATGFKAQHRFEFNMNRGCHACSRLHSCQCVGTPLLDKYLMHFIAPLICVCSSAHLMQLCTVAPYKTPSPSPGTVFKQCEAELLPPYKKKKTTSEPPFTAAAER